MTSDGRTVLHHAHGGSLSFILGPCGDTFDKGAIFNPVGDGLDDSDVLHIALEFGRRAARFTYTETAGAS